MRISIIARWTGSSFSTGHWSENMLTKSGCTFISSIRRSLFWKLTSM
ncbi:GXWXG domain-containing protein [Bacteroides gallinaceum]